MSNETERQQPDDRKKTSQTRQRKKSVNVGLTPDERCTVEERAGRAGLSLAAYGRACLLGDPGPRAKRQPPVNRKLLVQAVAELNKIGSNINQIARALNSGHRVTMPALEKAAEELSITLSAVVEALGKG